jgi:hypothetical protein
VQSAKVQKKQKTNWANQVPSAPEGRHAVTVAEFAGFGQSAAVWQTSYRHELPDGTAPPQKFSATSKFRRQRPAVPVAQSASDMQHGLCAKSHESSGEAALGVAQSFAPSSRCQQTPPGQSPSL